MTGKQIHMTYLCLISFFFFKLNQQNDYMVNLETRVTIVFELSSNFPSIKLTMLSLDNQASFFSTDRQ